MRNDKGFSLLELLLALFVTALLSVGVLQLSHTFTLWSHNFNLFLERDENLRLLPLLFSRHIPHAANRCWILDCEGVSTSGGVLSLLSDIDGSSGFPDGELSSSFENVRIRLLEDTVQLQSSTGGFQPLVRKASAFEVTLIDEHLTVDLAGTSGKLLASSREEEQTLQLYFCIWNLQPRLFSPDPEGTL